MRKLSGPEVDSLLILTTSPREDWSVISLFNSFGGPSNPLSIRQVSGFSA